MFNEKQIRFEFWKGIYGKIKKDRYNMYDPAITKLIGSFIPKKLINKNVPSLLDLKAVSGIGHTTVVLEYLKRFENKTYLLFNENLEISNMYLSILSMLKWSITDIPYKNSNILTYLISHYMNLIEKNNSITETNITHCRYILQKMCYDTEAFLESIYYIFRFPQWSTNHNFIIEYVQTRIGQPYYFT